MSGFIKPLQLHSEADLAGLIKNLLILDVDEIRSGVSASLDSHEHGYLLAEDDLVLVEVKSLLMLGSSGIILRGSPGTGKSWYADQIALALTEMRRDSIFRVQFHPSFTYEDFFDGYVPDEATKSGFKITGKIFRKAIEAAKASSGYVVLIIDEINRGNTSKIFGEALTYIESGWRGVDFVPRLATDAVSVPQNLVILATMNPHDRSITQLDMAMLRRFDHIDLPPSSERVAEFLEAAGMKQAHANLVVEWFETLQKLLPFGLGHTFFRGVSDVAKLSLIWRYRILPFCESIFEFEPKRLDEIKQVFEALGRRMRDVAE